RSGIPLAAVGLRGRGRDADPSAAARPSGDDLAGVRHPRLRRSRVLSLACLASWRDPMRPATGFDLRDGAMLVEFPEASDEEANRASVALAARLRARSGVHDAIPGARSLVILFDPLRLSSSALRDALGGPLGAESDSRRRAESRTLIVPVVYDGPDLDEL